MDTIVFDQRIDGRMQFDAGGLKADKLLLSLNIVDVISGYLTENRTQAAADSSGFTIVDCIVPDDVRTNIFL